MAIDFPNSPTPGQEFQGYYWDNDKQAWRSQSTSRSGVITSATTPTGATAGDMWFNTVDGTLFVYYDDGITTQWVEVQANVDNYKTPSQNYILNSSFDIWQRGTSIATGGGGTTNYACDRWRFGNNNAGGQYTISRVANTSEAPGAYAMRLTSSRVDVGINGVEQVFEYLDVEQMRNKQLTLSFWVRSSTPISFTTSIQYGTLTTDVYPGTGNPMTGQVSVLSQTVSSTTVWQRVSFTSSKIPIDAGQIRLTLLQAMSITSGVWLEFAGVQLEEGTIATPFRRNANSISGELNTCLRYFNRYSFANGDLKPYITKLSPTGSGAGYGLLLLPVPMRVAPTTTFSAASTFQTHVPGILINSPTGISALTVDASPKSIQISTSGSSGFTYGQAVDLQWNSSGGGVIDISAEL